MDTVTTDRRLDRKRKSEWKEKKLEEIERREDKGRQEVIHGTEKS